MNKTLLKRALVKCKYNQAELARQLGLKSRSFIGQILKGDRPLPRNAELNLNKFMNVNDQ